MRFSRAGRNWADSTSLLNEESGLEGRFGAITGGCAVSPRPIKVQMKCFSETVLETVLETEPETWDSIENVTHPFAS